MSVLQRSILMVSEVDMLAFAIDRLTPACIVLVTGDRDFSYAAAILKLRGYRILVISPSQSHASLRIQADELYDWQTDVLESVDVVIDPGRRRSNTSISSTKRPPALLSATNIAAPACRSCSCANTSAWTGTPGYESGPVAEQRPETSSLHSGNQNSHSSCRDASLVPIPSLPGRSNNEAGFSAAVETQAMLDTHLHSFTRPMKTLDSSVESGMISAAPEIASETPTPEQMLTANRTGLSSYEAMSSITTLCDRASSSPLGSIGTSAEAVLEVSAVPRHGSCSGSASSVNDGNCHLSTNILKESSDTVLSSIDQLRHGPESILNSGKLELASPSSLSTAAKNSSQDFLVPTLEDRRRFLTLITFFIERKTSNQSTCILSSEVATQIRRRDPQVYEKAGVTKLKDYIEAARKAGVVISSGLNNEGSSWVEINSALYPPAQSTEEAKKTDTSSAAVKQSSSQQIPQPASEWVYAPLTNRLRSETPTHRLLYSSLGMFFKIRHPDLYKRAGVEGLSAYLEKAAKHGIILVGKGDSPGSEWAELMPAYRGTVFNGSTY